MNYDSTKRYCENCGALVKKKPGTEELFPHKRYAEGSGPGKDQAHEIEDCK